MRHSSSKGKQQNHKAAGDQPKPKKSKKHVNFVKEEEPAAGGEAIIKEDDCSISMEQLLSSSKKTKGIKLEVQD